MKTALILAGGNGTRLFPVSTPERPKQFVKLFNGKTLLQLTYDRVRKFINKENIYIVLPEKFIHYIDELLPDFNKENLIIEAAQKNTAPCILLSSLIINRKHKDSFMYVFPSDHLIEEQEFINKMNSAYEYIKNNKDNIITFGITPTEASTRFGYIEHSSMNNNFNKVLSFHEKPNIDKAKEYLSRGTFLWNSGILLFNTEKMLENFKLNMKEEYTLLNKDVNNYNLCKSISIDYAILEKVNNIIVSKCNFKWDDVGVFESLIKYTNDEKINNIYKKNHPNG